MKAIVSIVPTEEGSACMPHTSRDERQAEKTIHHCIPFRQR